MNHYIRSKKIAQPCAYAVTRFWVAGYAPLRKVLRTVAAWLLYFRALGTVN